MPTRAYSRVLRDYLLIAAEREIVEVHWSPRILDDTMRHLMANRPSFTEEHAQRLSDAMTKTFPDACVAPGGEHLDRIARYDVPDDDDRDVMATALACGATIICTFNLSDFPEGVMGDLGLEAMEPDDLFAMLIDDHLPEMLSAHRQAVADFPGATDGSTLAALRASRAPGTAKRMAEALGITA